VSESEISIDDVALASTLRDGWESAALSRIAALSFGQSPPSSTYNVDANGLPFFQGKTEFGDRYPTVEKWCTEPTRIAEDGDILLSVRAPVGPTNIAPCRCGIGRGLASIRPKAGMSTDYVLYYLRFIAARLASKGAGTTFGAITKPVVQAIEVPVAPEAMQSRIVHKVDELFSSIEGGDQALEKVRRLVGRYRQSVLKAAVTGELTRTWREKHADELESGESLLVRILEGRRKAWETSELVKMKARGQCPDNSEWKKKYQEPAWPETSNLPELPEGWVWARAEQVCDFITKGTTPAASEMAPGTGEVPYIKVYNLTFDGTLDFTKDPTFISRETHRESLKRSCVVPGDVLGGVIK
jgi:type I restriction enzyme S subunit